MELSFIPEMVQYNVKHHSVLLCKGNTVDAGMIQVIVILAGTNNHDHTASQIVEGLLEIVKTCQEKQPQADILVMVDVHLRYLVILSMLEYYYHVLGILQTHDLMAMSASRQHLSNGDCLEVKGKINRTVTPQFCAIICT